MFPLVLCEIEMATHTNIIVVPGPSKAGILGRETAKEQAKWRSTPTNQN